MAASTSVKYFHSAMAGAPTLNGTAGTLIAVLDACLKDGFNVKTADSVVVAGGIATLTVGAGVGAFEADTVALISGATPAGLNGEKRILTATATQITFDATGIGDQTATGTISAKLSPLGWNKIFSGTNLAAYQSADVASTKMVLRVDDTAAQNGRVVGYESMSDINTGVNAWPTTAQQSGGYYWPKANSTATTARGWTLIGDGKTFYLYTNTHTTTASLGTDGWLGGFGDFASVKSGDPYACFLIGTTTDLSASGAGQVQSLSHTYNTSLTNAGMAVPRGFSGIGSSILPVRRAESYCWADGHSGTYTGGAQYPNGPDNSLMLARFAILETTPNLRGVMRGPLYSVQNSSPNFNWRDKVDGAGVYAGRKIMSIKGGGGPAGTTTTVGNTFFDIYGPWA